MDAFRFGLAPNTKTSDDLDAAIRDHFKVSARYLAAHQDKLDLFKPEMVRKLVEMGGYACACAGTEGTVGVEEFNEAVSIIGDTNLC